MHTIFKYSLNSEHGTRVIEVPKGARFLHIQLQNDFPYVWALVDPNEKETEKRTLITYGTGHEIEDVFTMRYIGTWQSRGGQFMWHVFEEGNNGIKV